jgi:hypothetical protein
MTTRMYGYRLLMACAACLPALFPPRHAAAQEVPPYQIILRSRKGEVAPRKDRDGQTGGGSIEVVQRDLDTVMFLMRGAVVAAAEREKGGTATMEFVLDQDFEIVPTRLGLRPPRLSLAGLVIGTLQSVGKAGGSAEQGPACASVNSGGNTLIQFCIQPHSIGTRERLFVNEREGPYELSVAPGGFCLHQTFSLSATQPWEWCHHLDSAVGAIFDPDPRFEARWGHVLRPFRGVPHQDFGFGVVLRVVEEPLLRPALKRRPGEEEPGLIPPPRPAPKEKEPASK